MDISYVIYENVCVPLLNKKVLNTDGNKFGWAIIASVFIFKSNDKSLHPRSDFE